MKLFEFHFTQMPLAQWAGAIDYTDLHLCQGVRLPNKCPENDIKPTDGEAPALEIWGMWITPPLQLLPGPLWPRVVAPDRVLSMDQIE